MLKLVAVAVAREAATADLIAGADARASLPAVHNATVEEAALGLTSGVVLACGRLGGVEQVGTRFGWYFCLAITGSSPPHINDNWISGSTRLIASRYITIRRIYGSPVMSHECFVDSIAMDDFGLSFHTKENLVSCIACSA